MGSQSRTWLRDWTTAKGVFKFIKSPFYKMLPNPSSVCLLHDRSMTRRQGVETGSSNFIQRARYLERCGLTSQSNILPGSGCQFLLQNRKEDKMRMWSKMTFNIIKHLLIWPASGRGCVNLFFSVAVSRMGRVRLSLWDKQSHFSLTFRQRGTFPGAGHHVWL